MTHKQFTVGILSLAVLVLAAAVIAEVRPARSHPAQTVTILEKSDPKQYIAALDVARVFERSPGCADADPRLITAIAAESVKAELDPRILAATVAVESACDPMAVSRRGAVGLTQIMVKTWAGKFDFTGSVNLFNTADNLHSGATILSGLVKQYGTREGVRRYNGTGEGCKDCDGEYVPKILALAGRR